MVGDEKIYNIKIDNKMDCMIKRLKNVIKRKYLFMEIRRISILQRQWVKWIQRIKAMFSWHQPICICVCGVCNTHLMAIVLFPAISRKVRVGERG